MNRKALNELSAQIVHEALMVHRDLGPGMLESVYEVLLTHRLTRLGLLVERQKPVGLDYEGVKLDLAFRLDLLIENVVVVEVKSVEQLNAMHRKQLLTYLKLCDIRLGLLLNFAAPTMKQGIVRMVNRLPE